MIFDVKSFFYSVYDTNITKGME